MDPTTKQLSRTIAHNLAKFRMQRGLTQEQLAQKLSLPRSTISYFESTKANPTAIQMFQIAEFYRISIDDILREPPSEYRTFLKRENLSWKVIENGNLMQAFTSDDNKLEFKHFAALSKLNRPLQD